MHIIFEKVRIFLLNILKKCGFSGARQVGKTFIIRECLSEMNCDYIEINLLENEEYVNALKQSFT